MNECSVAKNFFSSFVATFQSSSISDIKEVDLAILNIESN